VTVFNAGSTETAEEYWIQAAHRPALGYPHAGQIVLRPPSAPAIVAIGVPLAVARASTRCQGRSNERRPAPVSASPVRPATNGEVAGRFTLTVIQPTMGLGNSPGGYADKASGDLTSHDRAAVWQRDGSSSIAISSKRSPPVSSEG
jgi:hypothetical protein